MLTFLLLFCTATSTVTAQDLEEVTVFNVQGVF